MVRPLACALALAAAAAGQDPAAIPIFDGRTLAGWSGDERYWSVEDGELVGRTTPEQPLSRNTFLVWDGLVGDFELELECRIEGGNSGVQYRSRVLGDGRVTGYQADLDAENRYTGMLYEEGGRGIVALRGHGGTLRADGAREIAPLGEPVELEPNPRWMRYTIRAEGDHLRHAVDGRTTVDVTDLDPRHAARSGRIALQLHTGPPMTVRFRNLRLRHLAPPPAEEAAIVASSEPEWIWARAGDAVWLRRGFELPAAVRRGRLLVTCDNAFELYLDGELVAQGDDWQRPIARDGFAGLAAGRHVLAVAARNAGGPAAFALRLDLELEDGREVAVVSDRTWRGIAEAVEGWRAPELADDAWSDAVTFGPVGPTAPWGDVFRERVATPAEQLTTREGFVVELLRSAQVGEDSWIALGFDGNGDVLVAEERGPLARVRFDAEGGTTFTPIAVSPRNVMGFCHAHGALYVQGAGPKGRGLYRLRDTDGDAEYDVCELFAELGSGGEHGHHAVRLGPDGRLWVLNGNMSELPETFASTSPHKAWAEDLLLPRLEDPRGHARGVRAPGGHLLRTDLEGREWEIVAAGMRNAYDFAFAPDGEAFTFDSDMEWDIGLPWYRPTRVVHCVSGAEFGWRTGAGKWPAYYLDSLPAAVDVGLSSPTGVEFGTHARFPERYRRALFVGDWAYGRILAVHLEPSGASFTGTFETFVSGKPLNVTDLAVGPDGALWFTTGGRGTQSGLYRVSWAGSVEPEIVSASVVGAATNPARELRLRLEEWHRPGGDGVPAEVVEALGHADRFVRWAARIALEHRALADVRRVANLAHASPDARLTAWLALARIGDDADRADVLRALATLPLPEDRQRKLDWLRVHAVAIARSGALDEELRTGVLQRLDSLYPAQDDALDRELLRLLVALGGEELPGRALDHLLRVEPRTGIDVAYALRRVERGWTGEQRETFFRWIGGAKRLRGGHSFLGYLEAIEADALEHVPEDARPALRALASAPEEPRTVPVLDGATRRAWTLADLAAEFARVDAGRDYDNGRAAYTKALCASCHRFDGEGGDAGPDLTAVANRFSRHDLVEAILDPSRAISDQYANTVLELRDGTSVVGRVVGEAGARLEVLVNPFDGTCTEVEAAAIAKRSVSPLSPMPPALLGMLSLEEVLDLLAYLESGGNRQHPAFH